MSDSHLIAGRLMGRRSLLTRIAAALTASSAALPTGDADAAPDDGRGASSVPLPPSSAETPAWVRYWLALPRLPIWESDDPVVSELIHAVEHSLTIRLIYQGGSTPGEPRWFSPSLVFQTGEDEASPIYVSGWCHERHAHRHLRVDRIAPALWTSA